MNLKSEINEIYKVQKEISITGGILSLLGWDEKTHMPRKGLQNRADQINLLHGKIHDILTNKNFYSKVTRVKNSKLSNKDRLVIDELHKDITKIQKIPKKFMTEMTTATVIASSQWEIARQKNNYKLFLPHLKKVISLKQKWAQLVNPKLSKYDALLELHEEGMTQQKLDIIFKHLKEELTTLLDKIKKSKTKITKLNINLTIDKQKEIIHDIIEKMGINFDELSLYESIHPFTTKIGPSDVRITTRFLNSIESFTSSVHEAGHALYELGLPSKYDHTSIGSAASTGLHESQSRFWENMIGKNKYFWQGYYKKFTNDKNITPTHFYKYINKVQPSFIRVQADEVTYPLHIILRYEIERDLISGKLKINDARNEWNKKFKEMFGLKIKDDNHGILQDVHWSIGAFGYFPTYVIGTIYASQIYNTMEKSIPQFHKKIQKQEFAPMLVWLRKNIHHKAKTKYADEIIKDATGNGLNPFEFTNYLKNKYKKIYNL